MTGPRFVRWLSVLALILAAPQAAAQTAAQHTGQFATLTDTDLPGGDIRVPWNDPALREISLERCQAMCAFEPACRAFTYNSKARMCFLKGDGVSEKRFAGAVSGKRLNDPGKQATTAETDVPKTHGEFEKLVLEKAQPASLQTDGAGAWHNIYRYILPARFLNRSLYEQALLHLASDQTGCDAPKERQARLACLANGAAEVASSLTLFEESFFFRKDAVVFAEQAAASDPAALIDVLLGYTHDHWTHGSLAEAETAVKRLTAIMSARPESATHDQRMRLAMFQALLADAHLDDSAALAALSEMVSVQLAKGTHQAASDRDLSSLLTLHLRGRFCPSCGRPVAEPMKRWLIETIKSDTDLASISEKTPDRTGLLLKILAAPRGAIPSAQIQAYAHRYLVPAPQEVAAIRRLLPKRTDDVTTAHMLALSKILPGESSFVEGTGTLTFERHPLKVLREPDPRRQAATIKKFLEEIESSNYGQFGIDLSLPADFEQASWYFENAGLRNAARLTLEFLIDWQTQRQTEEEAQKGPAKTVVNATAIQQARVFVTALARLAALQLVAGDRAAAAKSLADGSAIARAKLREEWQQGGERAILTMRDLSEPLRLIAQTQHELTAPNRLAENPAGADALFRAMQAAVTGETALTLEVARRRRILSTPGLAALHREHQRTVADVTRMAEIEKRYAAFNYDQVLTRARQDAEKHRDRIAAELAKLPTLASQAITDIEPVALADARKRLMPDEALVLLQVTRQNLNGLLLGHDGKTLAWRSAIQSHDLETLIRSLRAGADMVTARIPDFPVADAARLHDLIFGPIAPRLPAYRKLVILGDGPLQSLPYGILLAGRPANAPKSPQEFRAANLPWLVRTHAIALIPSIRSFVTQRSDTLASRAPRPFLGVGNPQLASAETGQRSVDVKAVFAGAQSGLADVALLRRLSSLPETETELRKIASVLNADPKEIIVGPKANEAAVKTLPLDQYRIIAFATHGALAGEVAGTGEPGLVLTPPSQATIEDDGFLSLSEIAGLKLDADLVILSACNTGTSDGRPRAESLSGLARGFFNAGARSLLLTHWTIPSDSAVKTTTGLMAARAQNPRMDWADALRQATLAIIDRDGPSEWAHPTFWGAFVAVGVLPLR